MSKHEKNRAAFDKLAQREEMASIYDAGVKRLAEGDTALEIVPNLAARVEALEARSTAVNVSATLAPPAKPKATVRGIDGLRTLAVAQMAEAVRLTTQQDTAATIRALLPDEANRLMRRATEMKLKGATTTAATTDANFGAELVETDVTSFYKRIAPRSVFAQLRNRATPFIFGPNKSITIPQRPMASEGDLAGAWVAERASIPVKQSSLGATFLSRHKQAVITIASNDLLRVTQGTLELFEDMIADDTAMMLDQAFDPAQNTIAELRPAGFYFGAPTTTSAGTTFANVISDIRWIKQQIVTARMADPVITMSDNRRLGLAMALNSDEQLPFLEMVTAGNIFGIPIMSSASHPDDIVGVIDAREALIAVDPAQFKTSEHASLVTIDNADPAPKMGTDDGVTVANAVDISDAAGTIPASRVISTYQTDAVALRMVLPVSYALRTGGTSAFISGVAW